MYVFSILMRIFDTQQSNVAELHSVLQRVSHELLHAVNILGPCKTIRLSVHLLCSLSMFLLCFLSHQTCHSMWSQTASRPWTFWRKASPTESRRQPTTMMPAADRTPSSASSTHRSSLSALQSAKIQYSYTDTLRG